MFFWCLQRRKWANIATWRRFARAVNTVTSSSWRRRCLVGCASDAASRLMLTWLRCSSWTRTVSAVRLTCSATSTESAPADRPVTLASRIRNCTPSGLALGNSPCISRPAIHVLPVCISSPNIRLLSSTSYVGDASRWVQRLSSPQFFHFRPVFLRYFSSLSLSVQLGVCGTL